MSERMVIVIEYDATTDLSQPRTEAITQIKEGANRLNPGHFVQLHVAIKDSADQVLAVFDQDASIQRGLAEAERGQTVRRDDLLTP
jgi:predicted transcriptional regulator